MENEFGVCMCVRVTQTINASMWLRDGFAKCPIYWAATMGVTNVQLDHMPVTANIVTTQIDHNIIL